ncbi:hypothetical protein UK23_39040 [Lentzea aerocolonigenes]|uniref:Uncharacterized protein n=1 Tax=Lentzea aerocolonigenes TaxID=68170 RepID=A0A0F0GKU9_LENAE|nr:hypothetical protein [Lentzea aerocolonigenes]KJK42048.1 hypothetical protein UK23_39040 [Lentzea aerocolonigenes]
MEPKAVPAKITPPTPAAGPQENCDNVLTGDPESCVAWTAPEPHTFSQVKPINEDETGIGKGAQWGPYYWCAAITDDVAEKVLGTKDVIRVISSKFYCQIAVSRKTGLNNTLSIHLAPYEPGNASFDWFTEPNPLGTVTQVKGRKAVRTEMPRFATSDQAAYTIEIPGHGSVWSVELQRSSDARTPFKADYDDADRKVLLAADALMAYDRT